MERPRGVMDDSKFSRIIDTIQCSAKGSLKASIMKNYLKEINDDVFNISVQRGLNDHQCSKLLKFVTTRGNCGMGNKLKILQNMVPQNKFPAGTIWKFMVWFTSNLRFNQDDSFSMATSSHILQWLIGLLEYDLVDSEVIYYFYDDLYILLEIPSLIPYAAKLLCKLTKPDDVESDTIKFVLHHCYDMSNKYILAILNVFKGYKPQLMPEDVKAVNVFSVLSSVPQTMDTLMKVRYHHMALQKPNKSIGIREVPTRNCSYFKEEFNKISSLIPLPTYNFEGMEKFVACYPNSIEEACQSFSRVPIPQNILSLLHSDVGFFMIMYQRIEVQMRFQNNLLQTLQNVLIYQDLNSSEEDVEFLLTRVYRLQAFMQQGIPSVSIFLSGFLLNWDGVDHRYSILKLIEWSFCHSFRGLVCNILSPLHTLFATSNTNMKKEIIRTLTNLIQNMFNDVHRVRSEVPFPFLKRGPKWTSEPGTMLRPLVAWTGNLLTLGLATEQDPGALLKEAVRFYTIMSVLEGGSGMEGGMFTVIPEDVVNLCLVSQAPEVILSLCGLLIRYNQEFLPSLRKNQPHFYEQCAYKIGLISNYAKQILYFLQNGQLAAASTENGMIKLDVPNESLASGEESFTLDRHLCFSLYVGYKLSSKESELENHLKKITEFINVFSPSGDLPPSIETETEDPHHQQMQREAPHHQQMQRRFHSAPFRLESFME